MHQAGWQKNTRDKGGLTKGIDPERREQQDGTERSGLTFVEKAGQLVDEKPQKKALTRLAGRLSEFHKTPQNWLKTSPKRSLPAFVPPNARIRKQSSK